MTYADPARWAERDTDAGTRPAFPLDDGLDDRADDAYDRLDDDDLLDPDAMVLAVAAGCAFWLAVMAILGWLA